MSVGFQTLSIYAAMLAWFLLRGVVVAGLGGVVLLEKGLDGLGG